MPVQMMVVMVIGVRVAHVKGRSLVSLGFRAAIRSSERVRGVPVSISLHQVALCWRWPQHELYLLSLRLEKELRVLVGVVHPIAVHAGLAGFSRCLGEDGGTNLGQRSNTMAIRKLTLHANCIHICVCLQTEKNAYVLQRYKDSTVWVDTMVRVHWHNSFWVLFALLLIILVL